MELSEQDHKRLMKFYARAINQYGPKSPQAVHWSGHRDQLARFDVLTKIASLSNQRILDVGSGLGDLYDFLQNHCRDFRYLGIDILPAMVLHARQNYPAAQFNWSSVFDCQPGYFDYVLASGALSFSVTQSKAFYYQMIAQMFAVAAKGAAFNMLDRTYYDPDDEFMAYTQEEIVPVAAKLTPNYKIITGYAKGDFTVYLYK